MRPLSTLVRCLAAATLASLSLGAAVVSAAEPKPAWTVFVVGSPTMLPTGAGHEGRIHVLVENSGGKATEGPAEIRFLLPEGLRAMADTVGCSNTGSREAVCELSEPIPSGGIAMQSIRFAETQAIPAATVLRVHAFVTGGEAAEAGGEVAIRTPSPGEAPPGPGGIAHFSMAATGPQGEPATQAGGHPTLFTTAVSFNNEYIEGGEDPEQHEPERPVAPVRDLVFYLPLGMLGDATVAADCPPSRVAYGSQLEGCPPGSRIGTILPLILSNMLEEPSGLYNLIAEKGFAAEFALTANNKLYPTYAQVVRRNGQYVIRVDTPGISTRDYIVGLMASFDGDITETFTDNGTAIHYERGTYLTNPSDCSAPQADRQATIEASTWFGAGAEALTGPDDVFPALTGCSALSLSAQLQMSAEQTQADTPAGYKVALNVPQAPELAGTLATPPVRDISVTLPAGTSVSPPSANGLLACAATGPEGVNIEGSESEAEGPDGLSRPAPGRCPAASQIAGVTAETPLLKEPLVGHIFLAEPGCGTAAHPQSCSPADAAEGRLIRLYLELQAPQRGVIVKLEGHANIDPATGRITTVFDDAPQFPFSTLSVDTKGGPRASLANGQACGAQPASATLVPWSAPFSAPVTTTTTLELTGCTGAFKPGFNGGTVNPGAGEHSAFVLDLTRQDGEQDPRSITATLPPGLLASVADVARCPEPQASSGSCPAASQVGTVRVAVGPGADPYYEQGRVYFTGPYGGAPFGLSVVVPAVAGPFDLGDVVVRVKLAIDPHTTQVTATTDPLPQMLDGIPLRLKGIYLTLDNPSFTLNPTNCSQFALTGVVSSTQGATAPLSAPFRAHGCGSLPFRPSLSASTHASTSRANGVSLRVKIASPAGQANIGKVELTLPRQFPSRLPTLQKACTEKQFNANPAGCPEASNIGTAKAITPLLKVPLMGPAYLVSHGSEAFPDVVFVLQGEGVRIDVTGHTDIKGPKGEPCARSHHGCVTHSRFETVPDAPISSFEAILPQGPHSALGANLPASAHESLCAQKLVMPTTITGQNAAVINQSTRVQVTGCKKPKHHAGHHPRRKHR